MQFKNVISEYSGTFLKEGLLSIFQLMKQSGAEPT